METRLAIEECYWKGTVLSHRGTLTLTEATLQFEPSRISLLAGMQPWELYLEDIQRARFEGIERVLVVSTSRRQEILHGPGARVVGERLLAVLAAHRSDIFSLRPFEADEQVLSRGEALRYTSNLLAVSGEFVLTTRCLRFIPNLGLQRFIWSDLEMEISIQQIQNVRIQGIGRMLHIESELGEFRFGGGDTSLLSRQLQALVFADGLEDNPLLATWEAVQFKGALAYHGDLRIYAKDISFHPQGTLEVMMGVDSTHFSLDALHRVSLQGVIEKKIIFDIQGTTHSFRLANVEQRFLDIAQMLISLPLPEGIDIDVRGRVKSWEPVFALISPWFQKVPQLLGAPQEIFVPAVLYRQRFRVLERGYVCLTRKHVIFLPYCGPKGKVRALVLGIDKIKRGGPRKKNEPPLILFSGRKRVCIRPYGDQRFTDEFWACVSEITYTERPDEEEALIQDGFNRRSSFRVQTPPDAEVELVLQAQEGDASIKPELVNLSQGGCAVLSEKRLQPQERCKVILTLGGQIVRILGEVRMSTKKKDGYRLGIKFLQVPEDEKRKLQSAYMEFQQMEIAKRLE